MRRLCLVLGCLLLLAGCDSSSSDAPADPSTAYMLASLDNGSDVSQSDPSVTAMQDALDALAPKCTESETKLGDEAGVIHDDMKGKGIDESYLSILQHVSGSIPTSMARNRCADMFAAYAVLRENG